MEMFKEHEPRVLRTVSRLTVHRPVAHTFMQNKGYGVVLHCRRVEYQRIIIGHRCISG